MIRLVTVGSVPPNWGGSSVGGVAAVHQTLNAAFLCTHEASSVELVGMLATNRPKEASQYPPTNIPLLAPPRDRSEERAWYTKTLQQLEPDLVLFHHLGYRWSLWHLDTGVPFVGVIHSWNQLRQSSSEKAEHARKRLGLIISAASMLIFPSVHTLNEGQQLGLQYQGRTRVIPNPLSCGFTEENTNRAIPDYHNSQRILSVGAAIPTKRHDIVLQAAARLGLPIEIIGDGPELENLKKLAGALGLSSRAQLTGNQPSEYVAAAMRDASVLCVPSSSEAFGNVYIEALSCGTPVVGFGPTLEEIREAMGMKIGRDVAHDASLNDIIDAIRAVLSHSWDRAALKRRAKECFSPKITALKYATAMHEVADR